MGPIKTGLALVAFAAAGAAYLTPTPERPFASLEPQPPKLHNRYQVLQEGMATGCYVSKGKQIGQSKAELRLGAGCGADFASARFWADEDDGSVTFVTADGVVALRLSPGDGHPYEAFGKDAPLIALSYAAN